MIIITKRKMSTEAGHKRSHTVDGWLILIGKMLHREIYLLYLEGT